MLKNRLNFYLVLGIVVGLFLTACAGVVTGKIDMPTGLGTTAEFQSPAFNFTQADHSFGVRAALEARYAAPVVYEIEHFCHGGSDE